MKKHVYLLIAIVAVAFVFAKVVAVLAFEDIKEGQALDAPMVPCQLQQGCRLGSATQVKSREELKLNQAFHIELTTAEAVPEVSVSFSMVEMEIGYNRYKLTSDDGKHWQAEIRLPICTLNRADYIATWRVGEQKYQTALNVNR